MEPLSWSGAPADRILTTAMDEELEQYRLLAYLQRVEAQYREHKLYPWLDELKLRIGQLRHVHDRAIELETHMPGEIIGLDLSRGALLRKPMVDQRSWTLVLRSLERTLPPLLTAMERGRELRDELHARIRSETVGVVPLGAREGWLILRQHNEALVYSYSLPIVQEVQPPDLHRHVRTHYFATWTVGLSCTYEHIKAELVRHGPMPNPATFVFEADISLPRIETFLPLAKRIAYELVSGPLE